MTFHWWSLALLSSLVACGSGDVGPTTSGSPASTSPTSTTTPPAGWTQWKADGGGNGHWYRILRTGTDWVTARSNAEAAGAYLVTITSAAEEQFIINGFLTGADQLVVFWIGCTDQQTEDTWQWVTGEPFSYTFWKSGEPNGWDGEGEDYCCINWNAVRGSIGEWNDALVGGTKGYDNGANDGPYASIVESDTMPKK